MTDVKERPIIMRSESVQAILSGRKTQTRRVIKPQPKGDLPICITNGRKLLISGEVVENVYCPYGKPGDRLWVRHGHVRGGTNTAHDRSWDEFTRSVVFRHGLHRDPVPCREDPRRTYPDEDWHFVASRLMPRWASRLTLEITGVRVERVQEISGSDAYAEGIHPDHFDEQAAVLEFSALWDSINASRGYGWDVNPWVWVISFRVICEQNTEATKEATP